MGARTRSGSFGAECAPPSGNRGGDGTPRVRCPRQCGAVGGADAVLHPDGSGRRLNPVSAPFFGAVQVDDFQLVPLLKALEMPRVSLLLADDVGLGKTIEAGLILTELLIRRRVRRVLILTPASLTQQWQREMKTKFSLNFDLIDRTETHAVQRRLGLTPIRGAPSLESSPPITTSASRTSCSNFLPPAVHRIPPAGGPRAQLPWDLLIVDEAHNLLPSPFGEDNQLVKALREITPLFEHKLFLQPPHTTATRGVSPACSKSWIRCASRKPASLRITRRSASSRSWSGG